METIRVEVTEEVLLNIIHVCSRYQGRQVDRCDSAENWAKETINTKHMEIEMVKIMKKFQDERRAWLDQFKKGDIWKPKAWKCKKFTQKWCEYEPFDDPACDGCIHCGHPYERK